MIVSDASVLIAHFDETDDHHGRASELLLEAVASPLAASPITVAEVLVGPARAGRLEEARLALNTLGVQEIALDRQASTRLAVLRAETNLKLPDCCVLLVAQDAGAHAVLSFDERLAAAARRVGLTVL